MTTTIRKADTMAKWPSLCVSAFDVMGNMEWLFCLSNADQYRSVLNATITPELLKCLAGSSTVRRKRKKNQCLRRGRARVSSFLWCLVSFNNATDRLAFPFSLCHAQACVFNTGLLVNAVSLSKLPFPLVVPLA